MTENQITARAYALGKQENDMEDTVIQGWVCRDKRITSCISIPKSHTCYSTRAYSPTSHGNQTQSK